MIGRDAGVAALLSGLVLVGVTACGSNDPEGAQTGPVITIHDEWDSYPTALIAGPLSETYGCLLIHGRVVFWPKGTTWDADAKAVIETDGTKVAVGERFVGGGGSSDPGTDFRDLLGSSDAAQRIATCVEKSSAEGVLVATP